MRALKNCAPVAQLDRVPGYEPGGREFESLRARHIEMNRPPKRLRFGGLFISMIVQLVPVGHPHPFAFRLHLGVTWNAIHWEEIMGVLDFGALGFWIFIAAIIVAGIWSKSRREAEKHETLRRMVEKTGTIDE